ERHKRRTARRRARRAVVHVGSLLRLAGKWGWAPAAASGRRLHWGEGLATDPPDPLEPRGDAEDALHFDERLDERLARLELTAQGREAPALLGGRIRDLHERS